MFELKRLSREGIPAALEKAQRYRLLNEPHEAESICRDVLDVEPSSQEARVTLLLALTDQFDEHRPAVYERARQVLAELADEYSRAYYAGIVSERGAKALFRARHPGGGAAVYERLRRAMAHYEQAAERRPPGNDDAILRWNACARLLMEHRELAPAADEAFSSWLE
jgi:hypothetical protein